MRILIASIILLVINGIVLVPGFEENRDWAPIVSAVIGIYLLVESVVLLKRRARAAPVVEETPTPAPAAPFARERDPEMNAHLVHFLGLLQEKGRLLDFVMDDITPYNDEQVAAAARVVHQGCSKVVREHFSISPVHDGEEGSVVTLDPGYDSFRYRAIGKLSGSPPFQGKLLHRGWKTEKVDLPRLAEKRQPAEGDLVVAPAEVEVRPS